MNNFEVSNNSGGSSVFMQDILSNHNKPQEKTGTFVYVYL